jgi:hypothetical protein
MILEFDPAPLIVGHTVSVVLPKGWLDVGT